MISKKREADSKLLLLWFQKANVTYLVQSAMLGQLSTFDYVIRLYAKEMAYDFEETVIKYIVRCKYTCLTMDQCTQIFRSFKKH